jgi:DNA endonuclease
VFYLLSLVQVVARLTSNKAYTGRQRWERQPPWNRYAQFIPASSEAISYIIGVYMGDGSIYRGGGNAVLRLQAKDKEFVKLFAINCEKLLHRRPSLRLTARGLYEAQIASRSLCNFLEHGLHRQDPLIQKHPSSFIRGLADSDGSALVSTTRMRRKPRFFVQVVVATSTSIRLLSYTRTILRESLGLEATFVYKGKPRPRVYKDKLFDSRKRVFDLRISRFGDVKRFSRLVGFGLTRKQVKLDAAIAVRERFGSGQDAVEEWARRWEHSNTEWILKKRVD